MSFKSKIIIVITIVWFILGHRVNQFLRCMSIMGCGPRTFFIGYFHFLPLAKIPPVVINNSIPLSGYYYYFQVCAMVAPSLSALPETQMLCAYLLTILGAEIAHHSHFQTSALFILMVSLENTAREGRRDRRKQRCKQTVWILPAGLECIPTSQRLCFPDSWLGILGEWMERQTHHYFKGPA